MEEDARNAEPLLLASTETRVPIDGGMHPAVLVEQMEERELLQDVEYGCTLLLTPLVQSKSLRGEERVPKVLIQRAGKTVALLWTEPNRGGVEADILMSGGWGFAVSIHSCQSSQQTRFPTSAWTRNQQPHP